MSAFDATRESAWIMPTVDRRALVVEGRDRKSWLNGLVTCDVAAMTPESAKYGLAVQKNGRIISDFFVIDADDKLLLFVPTSVAEDLCRALDTYLIMEEATVTVGDYAIRTVLGPAATLAGYVAKQQTRVSPLVRTYDGWGVPALLFVSASSEHDQLLQEMTAIYGTIGTAEEWAQLRAHAFIPEFGVDFDASMYPQEAGLETRAVSFSKGCYLGQEVVCMLEMRGQVRRKLVMLSYEGAPLPFNSKVLSSSGDSVGETKSAVNSALVSGQSLGFAMVKRTHADVGSELVIANEDGSRRSARVVERTWP